MDELKKVVIERVDEQRDKLLDLSMKMHSTPEIGFRETKASTWLTNYLEEQGLSVERGICEIETAFRATYGKGKPTIAFLAEYDALPDIGHACGHNLIATAAVGACVACIPLVKSQGNSVIVLGTPAEELLGGKVLMAERGAFDDLDAALMFHPGAVRDMPGARTLGSVSLDVEFKGKASHAAMAPDRGVNALDAMVLAYNSISCLRQQVRDMNRIQGIITKGGEAPNIIPDHTTATFWMRSVSDKYLETLQQKVLDCFQGAATATGCELEYRWGLKCLSMRNNDTLAGLFLMNLKELGHDVPVGSRVTDLAMGSTDAGNASILVPLIEPFVAITPEKIALHTKDFATAAASEMGRQAAIDSAKAMAMTVVDLVTDPHKLGAVRDEFEKVIGKRQQ